MKLEFKTILEALKYLVSLKFMTKRNWIILFLALVAVSIIQKIFGISYITDTFALGMMGYVAVLIGLKDVSEKEKK